MSSFIRCLFRYFYPVVNKGKNNIIVTNSKYKSKFYITIHGNSNIVEIGNNCSLENTTITIIGDNNYIHIDSNVRFMGPSSILMEGSSILKIGNNTRIRGVKFVVKDGTIEIGEDCMTSYGVLIRNHDSHKVYKIEDMNTQINMPKDIFIGNHVWLCEKSTILKNVTIGESSIVAYGAVVTKSCASNSIVAGNPATIVKQGVTWAK